MSELSSVFIVVMVYHTIWEVGLFAMHLSLYKYVQEVFALQNRTDELFEQKLKNQDELIAILIKQFEILKRGSNREH